LMYIDNQVAGSASFTVRFDDEVVLHDVDGKGRADFHREDLVWGARRQEWNSFLHDRDVLNIPQVVEYDVGAWPTRFQGAPDGGLFLFRFPEGIELTVTGVDHMTAVVKLKTQPNGQTGYCGNFNGNATDEFTPPTPGSVPQVLVPAWNIPKGEGLEAVLDAQNLFLAHAGDDPVLRSWVGNLHSDDFPAQNVALACPDALLAEAERRCSTLSDVELQSACIADICQSGRPGAEGDTFAAEVLQTGLQAEASSTRIER